jgi:hypothetical protein
MMRFLILFFILIDLTFSKDWQDQIIEEAKELYGPIALESFSKPLIIRKLNDRSVVASADHGLDHLSVNLYQGLLDAKRLNPDSLRMVICHELGHLFAGAPRKNIPMEWDGPIASDGMSYMSSEGQADYYASAVCFRKLLENSQIDYPLDRSRVGPHFLSKCQIKGQLETNDLDICLRAGMAGFDFLNLAYEFDISCENHSEHIASQIIRDAYPDRQCRLDTFIQGSFCNIDMPLVMDFFDDQKNTCFLPQAGRTKCWYPHD